jgi:hypothetical protein
METIKQKMEATKAIASELKQMLVAEYQERFYPQYQVHYSIT